VTKATLIVVPTTLLGQWYDELDTRVDKPIQPVATTTTTTTTAVVKKEIQAQQEEEPKLKKQRTNSITRAPITTSTTTTTSTEIIDLCSDDSSHDSNPPTTIKQHEKEDEEDVIVVPTNPTTTSIVLGRRHINADLSELPDPPTSYIKVLRLDQLNIKSFFSVSLNRLRYPINKDHSSPSRWGYDYDNLTPLTPKRGDILEYRILPPYAIGEVILQVDFRQFEYNGKSLFFYAFDYIFTIFNLFLMYIRVCNS